MLHVTITELSPDAFAREASKIANVCINKTLHYIQEADIHVYNLDFDAYNVTALADQDGLEENKIYIIFSDDNKCIKTIELYTYEFMDLTIA